MCSSLSVNERGYYKWLTDISQVQCSDGKLYIAPVFDCFGGEIISLAMDTNMKKELCISAVEAAFKLRNPWTTQEWSHSLQR